MTTSHITDFYGPQEPELIKIKKGERALADFDRFLLWMARQPANRKFDMTDPCGCLFHAYLDEEAGIDASVHMDTFLIRDGDHTPNLAIAYVGTVPKWGEKLQHDALEWGYEDTLEETRLSERVSVEDIYSIL